MREDPDISSKTTGLTVEPGEVFEVDNIATPSTPQGPTYLKVAGRDGWVFDEGIAGRWEGKPIVEQIEAEASEQAAPSPSSTTNAATQPLEAVVALATARVETLRLPGNMLGAGFEFVQLEVKGASLPLTFLLGTGFPANALTERGRQMLNIAPVEFKGGWLSQATKEANKVTLEEVRFVGSGSALDDIPDCEVLDFPQAQLAAQMGLEVHGILGLPFFDKYDVDLDRYAQRLQLFTPGQAASQGFYSTVKHLPGLSLPSGNMGVAVRALARDGDQEVFFLGVLDSGSAHTVLNWEAAKLLGYSGPQDPAFLGATKMLGASAGGEPEEMPVVLTRLSLCGVMEGVKPMIKGLTKEEFDESGGKGWYFEKLSDGSGGLELGAVNVAIGDVLGLSVLGDSSVGPFTGAAAIIGQDLMFQAQRVVLNAKDKQLWLEAGDIRDAAEM